MGKIRIGVSGWNYAGWRGGFYPHGLSNRDQLNYAAGRFDTVEINATFYGLTKPTTVRSWRDSTPAKFVFSVKGSRFITHNKKLSRLGSALPNFLASGVLELNDKLGPFLWQISRNLHFDANRIDTFLAGLPKDTDMAAAMARDHDHRIEDVSYGSGPNRRIRHALEVRHESYMCEEMAWIARRHGVALVFSHSSVWPYFEQITAGFVYLRLHGPKKLYASAYGEAQLEWWAERIRVWKGAEQPTDAATFSDTSGPDRKERDVYVYFDNDEGGHAPREAMHLRGLIADEHPG